MLTPKSAGAHVNVTCSFEVLASEMTLVIELRTGATLSPSAAKVVVGSSRVQDASKRDAAAAAKYFNVFIFILFYLSINNQGSA